MCKSKLIINNLFFLFFSLIFVSSVLAQPVLQLPANNSDCIRKDTVTFQWAKMTGANSYMVTVSLNSDLSSPIINHLSTNIDTNKASYALPSNGVKYYWKCLFLKLFLCFSYQNVMISVTVYRQF